MVALPTRPVILPGIVTSGKRPLPLYVPLLGPRLWLGAGEGLHLASGAEGPSPVKGPLPPAQFLRTSSEEGPLQGLLAAGPGKGEMASPRLPCTPPCGVEAWERGGSTSGCLQLCLCAGAFGLPCPRSKLCAVILYLCRPGWQWWFLMP